MLKDTVICDDRDDTRTHKVFHALDEVCYQFDLGKPIWLDANIQDFKRHDKTRFTQDNFIENIDFDYLEIHVIEEDWGAGLFAIIIHPITFYCSPFFLDKSTLFYQSAQINDE